MFSKLLYQELEDYRLTSLCKEGNNGAIFQAIHRHNQSVCAIKILDIQKLSIYSQEKGIEDFLSYLKILEKLQHPAIVSVWNSGRYQQFIWIAEEWMEGLTLQNFLEQNGKVEISIALKWMESCLDALDYLYQKEIKHNNLKPENIWILEKESKTKLSGLGLGTDIVDIDNYKEENLKPLNPHYLSPEQILRQKSDIRTDLYVLGAIFYEMITGHTLYEGNYPFVIMQHHVNGIHPSFIEENPEIPEEIFVWLLKLLGKSPQERFLNPAEFRPFLKKSLSNLVKIKEVQSISAQEYPIPIIENKDEWEIPLLEFPKEARSVEKTQSLTKVKNNNRPTKAFSTEFIEEDRKKRFQLSRDETRSNIEEEDIEIVKISKAKKLPFQPAVFDDASSAKATEDSTSLEEKNNTELEHPPTPLPKDFVTEHRNYYYTPEVDTSIRLKAKATSFPQENVKEIEGSLYVKSQDQSKIDRTKRLVSKKENKDTKGIKKYKKNINYFFIFCMTVLTLSIFFIWYKIESAPRPVNQPKIVKRPKIIYMITENLGWFGENMPKGMTRSEKRGEYIWKKDESIMHYVPKGPFWRGDDAGKESERPAKKINLSEFYIDKYELTNGQYLRFTEETGYNPPGYISKENFNDLKQPVVGINWHDAQRYARWAEKRVPTEAEWEKAAKGGLIIPDLQGQDIPIKLIENPMPKRIYSWGNEKPYQKEYRVANYKTPKDNYIYPAPVTVFPEGSSPYGCLNMIGNVWELCNDKFDPAFYNTLIYTDPVGPENEIIRQRVCRGGSWGTDEAQLSCFHRFSVDSNYKGNSVGVRLAKSCEPEKK